MDVWKIDAMGNITNRITDKTQDAFYMVEEVNGKWQRMDGEQYSISFEYGTVKDSMKKSIKDSDGNEAYSLTMFEIKGDDNAQKLFEVMSNNPSNVEWSNTKIGMEGSEQNIVGTTHTSNMDAVGGYLKSMGYTIREHIHNHPNLPYISDADKAFSSSLNALT